MRVGAITLLFLLAVLPVGTAAAATSGDDERIVVSGPVEIAKGETAGDVVVLDGPVTGAGRVRGDLWVVSGGLTIEAGSTGTCSRSLTARGSGLARVWAATSAT